MTRADLLLGMIKKCFSTLQILPYYAKCCNCICLKESSDAKLTFTCLNINVCWQCVCTSTLQ